MKKNRMLRLASALLILTLLTTSVIGGTFAKYTSTGSVSDTARVAKWGVEIKTSGTLYSDAYAKAVTDADSGETSGNLPAEWKQETTFDTLSVASASVSDKTENIVAPGTKSYANGLTFGLAGTPEVAVKVSANITAEDIFLAKGTYGVLVPATVSDKDSLKKVIDSNSNGVYSLATGSTTTYSKVTDADSYNADTDYFILTNKVTVDADYFPVVYELTGSTNNTGTGDSTTASGIASIVAKAIKTDATGTDQKAPSYTNASNETITNVYKITYNGVSADFAANTDLGDEGPKFKDETLTWAWPFAAESSASEEVKKATDAKDTLLGDLIAMRGASPAVDYVIVDITTVSGNETVTKLEVQTTDNDYTVKKGTTVVANLYTQFSIELTVTQQD